MNNKHPLSPVSDCFRLLMNRARPSTYHVAASQTVARFYRAFYQWSRCNHQCEWASSTITSC